MAEWVLILWIGWRGYGITYIPSFKSEAACQAAVAVIRKAKQPGDTDPQALCVER